MRDEPDSASPHSRDEPAGKMLFVFSVLVAISWFVYRPDLVRPFPVVDFAEFLPLLEGAKNPIDATRSLADYYGAQGRFNVLSYALLALKWELFGSWLPGWQLVRAGQMVTIALLTFVLLRRLGSSRLGSLVGASVFLWAPAASDGWIRLTMAEPLGALITLSLSIRATRFQATKRWIRDSVLFGVGAALLLLTKELLAPLLLLPLAIAVAPSEARSSWDTIQTPRSRLLIALVTIGSFAALVPVVFVYFAANASAYASLYGRETQSLMTLVAIWISSLIPFEFIVPTPNVGWIFAVVGFTILMAAGWRMRFARAPAAVSQRWVIVVSLLVSLLGTLAYLPAPWFIRFYLLPYLIGTAILLAIAVTNVQSLGRTGDAIAWSCLFTILPVAATTAAALSRRTDAIQRRDNAIVDLVATTARSDSVFFATSQLARADWRAESSDSAAPRGLGATLHRFAAATHRPWPPTRDMDCLEAREVLKKSNETVVNFEHSCVLNQEGAHHVTFAFRHFDWNSLRIVADSARARAFIRATSANR
jgi:hypothetical protein